MATPYLFFVGFQAVLAALIGKSVRAYFIFSRKSLYYQRVQIWHVCAFITLIIGVDLVLLIFWEYLAPFSWTRVTMVMDRHGQIVESRGECSTLGRPEATGFLAALAVIYGMMILCLRFVSSLSNRFVEERHLAAALFQVFILVVPALIAAFSSEIGRFVILTTFILFNVFVVLVFTFFPKYAQIREQRQHRAIMADIEKSAQNPAEHEVDILDGLRVPMVINKFEKYAADAFVTESYLDVLQFKDQYEARNNNWRNHKAETLMNIYLNVGSLLQVVSYRVVETYDAMHTNRTHNQTTEH